MADSRIYQKATAVTLTGKYLAIDKSGQSDAEKILVTNLLPTSIYRFNAATVTAGEVQITFLEAFPVGTNYDLIPIWGWNADYGYLAQFPYDKTVTGFKINFDQPVTFVYLAIIIR